MRVIVETTVSGRVSLRRMTAALLASSALCLAALPAVAQDATWLSAPGSGDFNTAANWGPATVPTGTAFFGTSGVTALSFSADTTLGGLTFNAGASAYSFTNGQILRFTGAGITGGSTSITNSNSLSFLNASTAGSAAITNDSSGSVAFLGTSTAGDATIINDLGVINFFNSSKAGNATIIINNLGISFNDTSSAENATITNNSASGIGFTGASTAGSAHITNNSGGINFLDTSTAGNSTIANNSSASLSFFSTSTAGSAAITNTGNLKFFDTSTAGNAAITNNNVGLVYFYNTSTAGNANIVNNRDLIFQDTSTAGSATIFNNFFFAVAGGATLGNAIVTNGSGGLFQFSSTSTADNGTITNNGTLRFFSTSTGGNAAITNGASGLTDFSASIGPNGDKKLSAGSIAGGGTFWLGRNELTVGGNNRSTNVTGVIADGVNVGTGASLVKTGTGTMILSGINTYTGATTVNGGTLSVNGSILASSGVTVNAGGTLGGNGIVGNTTINGGTLAPGNSIGLLTVQGNLVLTAASSYMVEVSPANADRVNVTGTATLGAATVNASFAAGSYVAKQYTIVNATGGLGGSTFGSVVNTNLPSGFKTSLSYDANNAYLDLALIFIPPPNTGVSGNQSGVGNALVGYFNRNGGIPLVYGGLTASGLTQAAGETATGGQQTTFNAMTQFMGMMTDPFGAGRGFDAPGAMGYADARKPADAFAMLTKAPPLAPSFEARWSVWASGFGGSQTTNGNGAAGSNNANSSIGGVAVGADVLLSPNTVAGFSLAGAGTSFSVANSGSGRSDLFQAGAFVRHTQASAYVTAAVAYGWQDITTDRMVTVAGLDRLHAQFNANAFSGRIEAGNRTMTSWLGGVGVTPYVAAQVIAFDLPSYAESTAGGATTFALAYAGKTVTSTRSELGLRTDKSFAVKDAILTLRGRAAWAHDFNTDRSASATFQSLPGASFVVSGAAPARDAALTTASAEVTFISGISLAATFEGEFSDVTRSYAGKGVVRYTW